MSARHKPGTVWRTGDNLLMVECPHVNREVIYAGAASLGKRHHGQGGTWGNVNGNVCIECAKKAILNAYHLGLANGRQDIICAWARWSRLGLDMARHPAKYANLKAPDEPEPPPAAGMPQERATAGQGTAVGPDAVVDSAERREGA